MQKSLYIAYMTGSAGNSIGLYYIGDGHICGIDVGAIVYDGIYKVSDDGSLEGLLTYNFPDDVASIAGKSNVGGDLIQTPFKLPSKFWDGQIIRVDTPLGAVNIKFEKLKDLP